MNCEELDSKIASTKITTLEMMDHLESCKRCKQKYGLGPLLKFRTAPSLELDPAPGESQFLARLSELGKTQNNTFDRTHALHHKVQQGDRLFWCGDYDACIEAYRDALVLVRDQQGRVAILNKLARTQTHRHRTKDAIERLTEALEELHESTPPSPWLLGLASLYETGMLWLLMLEMWARRVCPNLFRTNTKYGDRSRAAQHIYRELSILSQHQTELSRWAHIRGLQWAVRLQKPLELAVSWGRHAVHLAQQGKQWRASWWIRYIQKRLQSEEPITQAAITFYTGRVAYLSERWDDAQESFEQCIELCESARDKCLYEASQQHLIRIYRNHGKFAQAIRSASELLGMYYKLGNPPRLSASCRHFALVYANYGDLRKARQWAFRALDILDSSPKQTNELIISRLRCLVLLSDLEMRGGQIKTARRYLSEAIRLQREQNVPHDYIQDGVRLLRQILGEELHQAQASLLRRIWSKLRMQWAVLRGDLERAQQHNHHTNPTHSPSHITPDVAYVCGKNTEQDKPSGLREPIASSPFAMAFLEGKIEVSSQTNEHEEETIATLFPVGAISSRWDVVTKQRPSIATTQFSDSVEAPWGYLFTDDID